MTLRLTVDTESWRANIDHVARRCPGLVPVVKGNGYGFGRADLAHVAAGLADTIAVGTIHELDHVPAGVTPVVLTPSWRPPDTTRAVLTVGTVAHVKALAGWNGRVLVKLASPVRRFGTDVAGLGAVMTAVRASGSRSPASASTRRSPEPTTSTSTTSARGSACSMPTTRSGSATCRPPPTPIFAMRGPTTGSGSASAARCGTATRPRCTSTPTCSTSTRSPPANMPATARASVPVDGHLVVVGAGTAHGVQPLDDGRSPFHFARQRCACSRRRTCTRRCCSSPTATRLPAERDHVDVQRPLITSFPDEIRWR